MPPLAALFARTFVIGIAVAAPVGAMGMLCVQRTLERGWRTGLATGIGIATADGVYAGLAAFGVAALSAMLVAWQSPLRLVGGAVLVYLGIRSMFAKPAAERDPVSAPAEAPVGGASHPTTYFSAVGLTLTNPMTIMAFGAIFASAGLVAQPGVASAAVATGGVALGSLAWWVALTTGVSVARRAVGAKLVTLVSRVSAGIIGAYGLVAIGSVMWPLVR